MSWLAKCLPAARSLVLLGCEGVDLGHKVWWISTGSARKLEIEKVDIARAIIEIFQQKVQSKRAFGRRFSNIESASR